MNRIRVLRKIRLKLEHASWGQQLMLLAFPFFARPHHFRDSRHTVFGKLSPVVPALFAVLVISSTKDTFLRELASSRVLSNEMWDEVGTSAFRLTVLLGVALLILIYLFAAMRHFYNRLLCFMWQNLNKSVNPAPFGYYLVAVSSVALWFLTCMLGGSYLVRLGVERTGAIADRLLHEPLIVWGLFVIYFVVGHFAYRNTMSSGEEIYGSEKTVMINAALAVVLALGSMFLLSKYLWHTI